MHWVGIVHDVTTDMAGHDGADGADGIRDILVQHGVPAVEAAEPGEGQVTVAAVSLLAARFRKAERRRKRAQLLGPFSLCCQAG